MRADLNRRAPVGCGKLVTGNLFERSGLLLGPRTSYTRKAVWPAPGFTDTRVRCHDETEGGVWDLGVFRGSPSSRRCGSFVSAASLLRKRCGPSTFMRAFCAIGSNSSTTIRDRHFPATGVMKPEQVEIERLRRDAGPDDHEPPRRRALDSALATRATPRIHGSPGSGQPVSRYFAMPRWAISSSMRFSYRCSSLTHCRFVRLNGLQGYQLTCAKSPPVRSDHRLLIDDFDRS
jgi:hypothetical protein